MLSTKEKDVENSTLCLTKCHYFVSL